MFALTRGDLAMVLFIFALVWGAGVLPRLGERLAGRSAAAKPPVNDAKRAGSSRGGG